MDRLRGRALESLYLVQQILGTYTKPPPLVELALGRLRTGALGWRLARTRPALRSTPSARPGATRPFRPVRSPGWGGTEAPRGALMHQHDHQRRQDHQVPVHRSDHVERLAAWTTRAGDRGAIEEAVIGAPFDARDQDHVRWQQRSAAPSPLTVASRSCVLPSPSIRASLARSTSHREVKILKRISIVLALSAGSLPRVRGLRLRELRSSRWLRRRHRFVRRLSPRSHVVLDRGLD